MRLSPHESRSSTRRWSVLIPAVAASIATALALPACTVAPLALTVTTTTDGNDAVPGNDVCEMTTGLGNCSLRAAVDEANAQGGTATTSISVPPGTYTLTDPGVEDSNAGGDLDTNKNISISGSGTGVVIDAANHDRVFDNRGGLSLQSLTTTGGRTAQDGGAVRSQGTSVNVTSATISASASGGTGGGVAVLSGTANVVRTTISGNTAKVRGGGVDVVAGATATITNSTISGNTVDPISPVSPTTEELGEEELGTSAGAAAPAAPDFGPVPDEAAVASAPTTAGPSAEGRIPVILELDVPTQPEPSLPAGAITEQRTRIAAKGSDAVRAAGPATRIRRTYASIPYVAVEVAPADLPGLLASGTVRAVHPDALSSPSLVQSISWINADDAHAAGSTGAGTTVAILDSGIELTHPAFAGKVVAQACFAQGATFGDGAGDCPNGTPTQSGAGAGVNCPQLSAACWHGTHVAGIAAASPFTVGATTRVGVARGANIIAVNVFSYFTGEASCGTGRTECIKSYTSDQMAALDFVYALRSTINIASVNMSLGGGSNTSNCDGDSRKPVIDNLKAAGISTAIATGNDGFKGSISAPACISSAVSVGATGDTNDNVASFSNSATGLVDLLAPGVGISSTYPGSTAASANGTSMATPHVAGALAVLKMAKPGASADQIVAALKTGGVPVTDSANGVIVPRVNVTGGIGALGGAGRGGGIANSGSLSMTYTTVTANSAPWGGGLATSSNVTMAASVVASQIGGGDCGIDPTGGTMSAGYNLASDGSCALEAANDTNTGAAQLGTLTNNGGTTLTHLPAAGSPLVNVIPAGTAGLCTNGTIDQRGTARPQGAACDTGAVDR